MGTRVGRVALFGIPLQQQWSYGNTGDFAPTYYLQTDAPLYYYSFTDAFIAMVYRSLPPAEQARFDPMITGFNPADMYAADHIRRVLTTFPACSPASASSPFTRSSCRRRSPAKPASLTNPALDRVLDFAGEAGLVVILHNDIDMPFPKPRQEPSTGRRSSQALFLRHPKTTIIWAHMRARPRRAPGAGLGGGSGAEPQPHRDRRRDALLESGAAHVILRHLVGRGREVRRRVAGSRSRASPRC